ncbi:MAG: gliding motility-associated C-terminal domain-containing protein, partial [Flavobacteriales bacterium]
GPLGEEIDDTQSIYVSIPGFYYCILTDYSGCILESNMVEVKEYSTPYLISYPGTELCVNGAVLIQIATNDYENIEWGEPFFDSAIDQWIYEAGTYNVSVTSCGITTALDITITDTDTPAFITPSSETFCPNDTITLTANGGMQGYLWQPGNVPYENLEVTEPGTYYLTTYDQLGCMGTAAYNVVEYEIINPIADGTTICAGESAVLFASSNNQVYWTTDENGLDVVANGYTFSTPVIEEETTYYVFAQDAVCASFATEVVVEIYFSSLPPIISGEESICLGADAMLISPMEADMNYLWTLPDGSTSPADSIFIYNATEEDEGDYTLTVADENCTASFTLFFDVVPQEILQLDDDNFIEECEGATIVLTSPVVADTYTWTTPSGILNGPQSLIINAASPTNAGLYTLTLTNAVCEFEIMPLEVVVNPYPDVALDPCTSYCNDGYMTVGFQEEYDWYLWSTGDSTSTVQVPDTGWYSVQVANNPNCVVSAEVYVPALECLKEFINVMTTNGDGLNENVDFGVLRAQIDAVHIYNRWGNVVETLTSNQLVWDGKNRAGEKVSAGVYYYVINYSPTQARDCHCSLPTEGYIHVFSE